MFIEDGVTVNLVVAIVFKHEIDRSGARNVVLVVEDGVPINVLVSTVKLSPILVEDPAITGVDEIPFSGPIDNLVFVLFKKTFALGVMVRQWQ